MANWVCEECGKGFKRDRNGGRAPIRFCSPGCYHQWRKGQPNLVQFQKGQTPWNKGMKGLHLSPDTEFKPGRESSNKLPIGTVRIRKYKRNNDTRAFVKIGEPNTWELRAKVVWEKAKGPIPKGLFLHHIDRDPLNDDLSNLALVTRASHLNEHRPEYLAKRKRNAKRKKAAMKNGST